MRVLVLSPVDPDALVQMREDHDVVTAVGAPRDDVLAYAETCEAIVLRSGVSVDAEVLEAAPHLRVVVRAGSGTDNLDIDGLARRGIALERIPEPGGKAVAELALTLALALSRNVLRADRLLRRGRWAKHELTGHALTGRSLGVVGAGNIGTRVGRLGRLMGMEVSGCVEFPTLARATELAAVGIRLAPFAHVVSADVVSVHVPLQDNTRGLIDAAAIERMPTGALLVNLSRGGVVDEGALRDALVSGRLAGAALDVHEHEGAHWQSPLADLDNVILTPHIGAGTVEAQQEIGARVLEILAEHAESTVASRIPSRPWRQRSRGVA